MTGNVLVSCRVRLARNLRDYPFPVAMSPAQRLECIEKISEVGLRAGLKKLALEPSSPHVARALMESHRISPEFAAEEAPHAVLLSDAPPLSIMVCEEDHLRIQAFGDDPSLCLKEARRVETLLDQSFPLAFDERLGYLTACPTNLGTGLRVSALLHLPALTETGAIRSIVAQAQQAGLSVRGFYGEGTQAAWGYYQISNAVTMGLTEEELVAGLRDVSGQLVTAENGARQALYRRDPVGMADRACRAVGLMRSARRISTGEAMEALSQARMGVSLGLVPGLESRTLDLLAERVWPGHLLCENPALSDEAARDEARATLLRRELVFHA